MAGPDAGDGLGEAGGDRLDPPDVVGRLAGYRGFHWDVGREEADDGRIVTSPIGRLFSLTHPAVWTPGEPLATSTHVADMTAISNYYASERGEADHKSPKSGCQCGLHAYYLPRASISYGKGRARAFHGIVSAWGDIFDHEDHFRAEFMRIEGLVHRRGAEWWETVALEAIGQLYGVPVVHYTEAIDFMVSLPQTEILIPEGTERPDYVPPERWKELYRAYVGKWEGEEEEEVRADT